MTIPDAVEPRPFLSTTSVPVIHLTYDCQPGQKAVRAPEGGSSGSHTDQLSQCINGQHQTEFTSHSPLREWDSQNSSVAVSRQ